MTEKIVALQRIFLRNLEPDASNIFVVGIIIAKQKPRKFLDAKREDNDTYKSVLNFTLRDSPIDYVNVTYWSNSDLIFDINNKFHIGDVVEVVNPKIEIRKENDYGEHFKPMVTSRFALKLTELSHIIQHSGSNIVFYLELLRLPTKPIAGFAPIKHIHLNGQFIKNEYIDVLGAVKGIKSPRSITTKNGEHLQVCEIEIFDCTAPSLKISLWDTDTINRAKLWKPRDTILFFTDLKIDWSDFEKSFVAKCSTRTIITENPITPETQILLEYARTAPIETFDIVDQMITSLPNPNIIQNVMSINQIHSKINNLMQDTTVENQFCALTFAFVCDFDLDGLSKIIFIKCSRCKMLINSGISCANQECSVGVGKESADPEINFDLKITLSDHTGSLLNCCFRGQSVELALNCTAQDFLKMNVDQKRELKWRYLLERCAARIAVVVLNRKKTVISIVGLERVDESEAIQKTPVY